MEVRWKEKEAIRHTLPAIFMEKKGTRFLSMIKHPQKGCPYLTQDGKDRESGPDQYIANMCDGALAGFKYFDLSETKEISVTIKGHAEGTLYVCTSENGEAIAEISISRVKNSGNFPLIFMFREIKKLCSSSSKEREALILFHLL